MGSFAWAPPPRATRQLMKRPLSRQAVQAEQAVQAGPRAQLQASLSATAPAAPAQVQMEPAAGHRWGRRQGWATGRARPGDSRQLCKRSRQHYEGAAADLPAALTVAEVIGEGGAA